MYTSFFSSWFFLLDSMKRNKRRRMEKRRDTKKERVKKTPPHKENAETKWKYNLISIYIYFLHVFSFLHFFFFFCLTFSLICYIWYYHARGMQKRWITITRYHILSHFSFFRQLHTYLQNRVKLTLFLKCFQLICCLLYNGHICLMESSRE